MNNINDVFKHLDEVISNADIRRDYATCSVCGELITKDNPGREIRFMENHQRRADRVCDTCFHDRELMAIYAREGSIMILRFTGE